MAEDKEEKKDDASAKSGMSVKKLVIILFTVFILILGIVVGLLVYLLSPSGGTAPANSNQAVEAIIEEDSAEEAVDSQSFFYTIRPPFTVNFIASRNAKFLRVSVDLVISSEDAIDHIEDNLPFIKNDFVSLFSSKSFDELKTPEGKEQLRAEALDRVQTILKRETGQPLVKSILFTSFVMD